MKIAIVGAGWYGVHLALSLSKKGHEVTLIEKNAEILSETSGNFGVRLHRGPHYPRSSATRAACQRGFQRFREAYPELLVHHNVSIYAHGLIDAKGLPSKVDAQTFSAVCRESGRFTPLDIKKMGMNPKEIDVAYDVDESSIVVGQALRTYFERELPKHRINVKKNCTVTSIDASHGQYSIQTSPANERLRFDRVISATGFQSLLPKGFPDNFPKPIQQVYQPCIAIVVKDKNPSVHAISFIVMDGMFPCLMPYVEERQPVVETYIMTHGSWTILGSCPTAIEAHQLLASVQTDPSLVSRDIAPEVFREMERFLPGFSDRFEYVGWKGAVISKIRNDKEFRSSFTFEDPDGLIHVFPGKIQNIFDVADEVMYLLNTPRNSTDCNRYRFAPEGVFEQAKLEITTLPKNTMQSTCDLQTVREIEHARMLELEGASRIQFARRFILTPEELAAISGIKPTFSYQCLTGFAMFKALREEECERPHTAPTKSLARGYTVCRV